MDCRNFKEKLSEFLDRQLAGPEAAHAEAHMSQCRGCRSEFEELKGLSSMVSGLGHRALPVGFMQRLERRRRADGQSAPAKSWVFLPPQARMAAFALSSLVVMFVVYDKAKDIMQPAQGMISGAAGSLSAVADGGGPVASQGLVASKSVPSSAGSLRGSGALGGGGFDALKKAASGSSIAAVRGGHYTDASAQSSPEKGSVTSTGQKLYHARGEPLAQDSLAMAAGGAGSGGAGAMAAAAPAPQHNYTNEELAANIEAQKRSMGIRTIVPPPTEEQRLQMGVLAGMQGGPTNPNALYLQARPSDPNINGETPSLLAVSSVRGGSNTQARGQAALADTDRLDEAPGVLIHSEAERQDLWHKYQITQNPPNVDYTSQLLAVVFATSNAAVQITSVIPGPDQLVIQYHEIPAATAATDAAAPRSYQFAVIPATDKPVVFQKLP